MNLFDNVYDIDIDKAIDNTILIRRFKYKNEVKEIFLYDGVLTPKYLKSDIEPEYEKFKEVFKIMSNPNKSENLEELEKVLSNGIKSLENLIKLMTDFNDESLNVIRIYKCCKFGKYHEGLYFEILFDIFIDCITLPSFSDPEEYWKLKRERQKETNKKGGTSKNP